MAAREGRGGAEGPGKTGVAPTASVNVPAVLSRPLLYHMSNVCLG